MLLVVSALLLKIAARLFSYPYKPYLTRVRVMTGMTLVVFFS